MGRTLCPALHASRAPCADMGAQGRLTRLRGARWTPSKPQRRRQPGAHAPTAGRLSVQLDVNPPLCPRVFYRNPRLPENRYGRSSKNKIIKCSETHQGGKMEAWGEFCISVSISCSVKWEFGYGRGMGRSHVYRHWGRSWLVSFSLWAEIHAELTV